VKRRPSPPGEAIWSALEREAASPKHAATFSAAKDRRAALANYDRAWAALSAARGLTFASMDEREAIVSAMLEEAQAAPHPLWAAMLARALEPMLRQLAGCLGDIAKDERDQHAQVAFIQSVAVCAAGPGVIVRLYWETRRQAIGPLKKARLRAAREIVFVDDDFASTWPSPDALLEIGKHAGRIAALEPKQREHPADYVARVNGVDRPHERRRLREELRHTRTAHIAEVRAHCSIAVNH
jgi:hypothetical protein